MPDSFVHLQVSAQMKAEDAGEVAIYGVIYPYKYDSTVTGKEMRETLQKVAKAKRLNIHMNSPGGIITEAVDIMGQIKDHPASEKNMFISMCCSAATLIALAATHTSMYEGGDYMIHRPTSEFIGNADDFSREAQALSDKEKEICKMYADAWKQPESDVWEKMKAETWFTAQQAKDYGCVDEVIKMSKADSASMLTKGQMMMLGYKQVPGELMNRLPEKEPEGTHESAAAAAISDKVQKEDPKMPMTMEELKKQQPELVAEIEKAATDSAAELERKRMQAIDEVTMPGYESMAAEAKYEKPVDAAAFSMNQAKAMKAKGIAYMEARTKETGALTEIPPSAPSDATAKELQAKQEADMAKMCAGFAADKSTVTVERK